MGLLLSLTVNGQKWVQMMSDTSYSFFEVREEFEKYIATQDPASKIPGRKQFDRYSYFTDTRVDSNGRFGRPEGTWEEYNRLKDEKSTGRYSQIATWQPVGPFVTPVNSPGMGRINCLGFHPTQSQIMYAGAASGGVWKTINGGNYWNPVSDQIASMGISSIVVDHQNPDIIYAATGDYDHSDTYSVGVIKSTDAGLSWNTTGLSWLVQHQRRISKIIMDPTNSLILYAASTVGVYKTIDGGVTWTNIRSGTVGDIALKPGNPAVIYAIVNTKLWRSTDYGNTFTLVAFSYNQAVERAKIAVTPADSNYVYLMTSTTSDSGFEGLYRSTDGGSTFTSMSSSPNILGYATDGTSTGGIAWYCLGVAVSPVNKNEVFGACVNMWRSTNGGGSWGIRAHWYGDNGLPYVHADIHDLVYHPLTGALFVCSDGGVDISTNSGASFQQLNSGLMIGQVYRIGVSKQDYRRIIGGWQDNGTHFMNNTTWKHLLGGDGMECIISPVNYNYMYGSMQYGKIHRTSNGGNDWVSITDDLEEGYWVTPFVLHPNSHSTLLAGFNNIYRSTNYGSQWTKISSFTGTGYYDKFRSLVYSPSNVNYIYASTYNRIYRSLNGGQNWVQVNNNLPSNPISSIAVHPTNPLVVAVTFSGFSSGSKVYMTSNGGDTWSNYSGTLPNLPANHILFEKNTPGGIYAAMDVGVFYRDSTLTDWIPFFDGLPNVKVAELEIHYDSHKLVAATYGRGIWWSDTYSWLNPVNELSPGETACFNIFPNPSQGAVTITLNNPALTISKIKVFSSAGVLVQTLVPRVPASYLTENLLVPSGIYLLSVELSDGNSTSGRIIIR